MRRESETLTLSELINGSIFANAKTKKSIGKVMKHSTIFSFWDDVVGKKFSKFTKPISIKAGKLFVSAKSPIIIQELTLYKKKLLQKINSYSMPLGIEVNDIIFNYKNFVVDEPDELISDNNPRTITREELKDIKVDSEIEVKIQNNIQKLKFLNDKQKKSFIDKIIDTYKVKNLQD